MYFKLQVFQVGVSEEFFASVSITLMVYHGLRACAFSYHCLAVCFPFPRGEECSDPPGSVLQTVLPFKDTVQGTMAWRGFGGMLLL